MHQSSDHISRTEQVLSSLDSAQKVPAPDFFYTRLQARMERENFNERPVFFLFRPAFAASCLSLLLMMNVILLDVKSPVKPTTGSHQTSPAEQFAKEYNLETTGSLYE